MSAHESEYTPGHMDIRQQQLSFDVFIGLTKWGSLAVAVGVLFFALWFCTTAGFVGAFVPAAVLTALGIAFLRDSGTKSAH